MMTTNKETKHSLSAEDLTKSFKLPYFEKFISIPIGTSCRQAEKMLIQQTLAFVNNNKSKAARILRLSRKTLHNKLRQYQEGQPFFGDDSQNDPKTIEDGVKSATGAVRMSAVE